MWVTPTQLIPNCILLTQVTGKTGRPIIPEKTVLTEEHIDVLQDFLIKKVNVSPKLANGKKFTPEKVEMEDSPKESDEICLTDNSLFTDHYESVIAEYKIIFSQWQNGFPIDMPRIRNLLLPLFERLDALGTNVYSLHHYATKEDYFYHHSVSVGLLAAYLAKKMDYSYGEQLQIGLAGFLSDCGMSKLNPNIFLQDRDLTHNERKEMEKHPTYSYKLVENIPTISQSAKLAILQHHERIDRSGYPLGLPNEKIHTYARIISVCDMYHAMTCERVYQQRQSPFKVVEELQTKKFSQLDPEVVQVFIDGLTNYSIGTKVRLSNDEVGEIIFVQPKRPTRPIVRLDNEQFIALDNIPELYIKEIIV